MTEGQWERFSQLVDELQHTPDVERERILQSLRLDCKDDPEVLALVELHFRLPSERPGNGRAQWHEGEEPIVGYRLLKLLGEGGFGQVWKVQTKNEFQVALKVIDLRRRGITQFEIRALNLIKQVHHPHLLAITGAWEMEQRLVIEMELADRSLRERLEEARQQGLSGIPVDELVGYMEEAAKGIDYLNACRHQIGGEETPVAIQHRDIKPENLLLQGGGIKVADFGLVKAIGVKGASHTGAMTPAYAAPEAFLGETQPQSDQYSLAATYYELRTGKLGRLDLSVLPAAEAKVVARALSEKHQDRWPNCIAFVRALRESVEQLLNSTAANTSGSAEDYQLPPDIQGCLKSFDSFILDRTRRFVPRDFIVRGLDDFIEREPSGYFVIKGNPGTGKSAVLAHLVKERHYIHHFNISADGRNKPATCIRNICAQIIGRFRLPHDTLPEDANESADCLLALLESARNIKNADEPVVIAVDALDEVEWDESNASNVLHLPVTLPDGVYLVVTMRRLHDQDPRGRLCVTPEDGLTIKEEEEWHRQDVKRYIEKYLDDEGVKTWIAARQLTDSDFVALLLYKSEANFMYLRYVLPALGQAAESGQFISSSISVDELPHGLLGYYSTHWAHMRERNSEVFYTHHQPVVCVLGAVAEAVNVEYLCDVTGLGRDEIDSVLIQWHEFLDVERRAAREPLYRLYHASFREYLQATVDPSLKKYKTLIGKAAMRRLGIA